MNKKDEIEQIPSFLICQNMHHNKVDRQHENQTVKLWIELSKNWLKNRGFVIKDCELTVK